MYNDPPDDEFFYLPDEIESIVGEFQVNNEPYFRWGQWVEISNILSGLGKHNDYAGTKFPLVYLPFVWEEDKQDNLVFNTIDFDLYLITSTQKNYKSSERLTNSFKNTLVPYYNSLITEMLDNKWFYNTDRIINHTVKYLPYLGHEEENQNKLNQVVDAIYLSFKNVQIANLKRY